MQEVKATINGRTVENGKTYRFTEPGWHTYRIEVKDFAGWKTLYEEKFEVYIVCRILKVQSIAVTVYTLYPV